LVDLNAFGSWRSEADDEEKVVVEEVGSVENEGAGLKLKKKMKLNFVSTFYLNSNIYLPLSNHLCLTVAV